MEVSFEEAAFGTEKEVTVSRLKYVRLAAVPEQSRSSACYMQAV